LAKGASRLKESTAPDDKLPESVNVLYPEKDGGYRVSLPARNTTIAQFASMMQRAVLDRPVVDRTGPSGKYDFDLEWAVDETQFGGTLAAGNGEPARPGLFAAVQEQLGLKLEAANGLVETLVIDRVERPSEN
jgi:uncharacterized protein (TIGR03435 family)